jgi:TPR repeat protein
MLASDPAQADAAIAWLEPAAKAGDADARAALGGLLVAGTAETAPDYVTAYAWLNLAAGAGLPDAAETRDLIAQLMTLEQIAEAQTLARGFFEAEAGFAPTPPLPEPVDQ